VESLNNKLDDLNVPGTSRFTLLDFQDNTPTFEALATCALIIEKLRCVKMFTILLFIDPRFFDLSILPSPPSPDFLQVFLSKWSSS
jgi:hypothetical protein